MEIMRSTFLVVLFSSFVCYGFENFWIDEGPSITSDSLKEDVKRVTDSSVDLSLEEGTFKYEKENEGSWVKDAGLGLGKAALGCICAYIALTTSFQADYAFQQPISEFQSPRNFIASAFYCWSYNLGKDNILNSLLGKIYEPRENFELGLNFELGKDANLMDYHLCCVLSSLSLIGASTYGGYKCIASAYDSFKKAYKKISNRSAIDGMGKLGLELYPDV